MKGLAQDFEDYASGHHLQVPLVRGWNGAEDSGLTIEKFMIICGETNHSL